MGKTSKETLKERLGRKAKIAFSLFLDRHSKSDAIDKFLVDTKCVYDEEEISKKKKTDKVKANEMREERKSCQNVLTYIQAYFSSTVQSCEKIFASPFLGVEK